MERTCVPQQVQVSTPTTSMTRVGMGGPLGRVRRVEKVGKIGEKKGGK